MATINISSITSSALRQKQYFDVLPEYYALDNVIENGPWHDHQNVLDHVIEVFASLETILETAGIDPYLDQQIGNHTRRDILKIATLLHDIGKADTLVVEANGVRRCPEHELVSASLVKDFAQRFDLNADDEVYVEKIVRYHTFTHDLIGQILSTGDKEKNLELFQDTVGDVAIELVLLIQADMLGSDLEKNDKKEFDNRFAILSWMLDIL